MPAFLDTNLIFPFLGYISCVLVLQCVCEEAWALESSSVSSKHIKAMWVSEHCAKSTSSEMSQKCSRCAPKCLAMTFQKQILQIVTAGFENKISLHCHLRWQFESHNSLKVCFREMLICLRACPGSNAYSVFFPVPTLCQCLSYHCLTPSPDDCLFLFFFLYFQAKQPITSISWHLYVPILVMCAFVCLCLSLAMKKPTEDI